MTPLQLRPPSLDEIVFEGRNKAYGAFDLRQAYPVHLRRGLAIAVTLFALMALGPTVARLLWPSQPITSLPKDELTVLVLPPPVMPTIKQPEPEPVAAASKPKSVPTVAFPTKVTPDHLVTPKPEPAAVSEDVLLGPVTDLGEGPVTNDGRVTTGLGGTDSGATKPVAAPAKPPVFLHAEKMPEFAGGQEALIKYLQRNMHYPSLALRNQVEGKVFVSFTVSATGDIVDVEVIKGLGFGTDEEATRVIRKMPTWQPGQQNGQAVAVRYTLPITFSIGK